MKIANAISRIDTASDELLAVHDAIKLAGVNATFPFPHAWNADEVVDLLDKACISATEAARLLAKVDEPTTRGTGSS